MNNRDFYLGNYSRRFDCPMDEECESHRERRWFLCPFRHSFQANVPKVHLPNFVCYNNLLDNCHQPYRQLNLSEDDYETNEGEAGNVGADGAPRRRRRKCPNPECMYGIHVSFEELEAGFETNPNNQKRIQDYLSQFPDADYKCRHCLENVRIDRRVPAHMEFAVFDGCSHVHCAKCTRNNLGPTIDEDRPSICSLGCEGIRKILFQYDEGKIDDYFQKMERFENEPDLVKLYHKTLRGSNVEILVDDPLSSPKQTHDEL